MWFTHRGPKPRGCENHDDTEQPQQTRWNKALVYRTSVSLQINRRFGYQTSQFEHLSEHPFQQWSCLHCCQIALVLEFESPFCLTEPSLTTSCCQLCLITIVALHITLCYMFLHNIIVHELNIPPYNCEFSHSMCSRQYSLIHSQCTALRFFLLCLLPIVDSNFSVL